MPRSSETQRSPPSSNDSRRTSILACRAHTDLTWDDIADIHYVPAAQAAFSRATVTHHRRTDPDFNHRYQQLLDHAQELQRAAGFANANLTRGLTSKQTTQLELDAGFNDTSHGKVA